MRLKVSPKEALKVIDQIIYEGDILRDMLWQISEEIDEKHKAEKAKAENKSRKTNAEKEGRIQLWDMQNKWYVDAKAKLKKIFLDFAPVNSFIIAESSFKDEGSQFITRHEHARIYIGALIKAQMSVLTKFYDEIKKYLVCPLFYIQDQAKLCFFASVCSLEPDSNEDSLCRYLFGNFNFNEWVEMEDIYSDALGGNRDEYDKQDRAKMENAAEGVNRKTKEAFGFSVFKKKKTLLALHLPTRFLREENVKMAL